MRPILVTGGAGFIGSHVCKALLGAGYRPIALDNLSRGNAHAVKWGPLEVADIRDRVAVEAVVERHRPEAVIHLAALAYVGESVEQPSNYYDTNVAGMLALVDGCLAKGVRRIVFSSSCATYGQPDRQPITETTPQRPINPYGLTKLIGEQILGDFSRAYALQHVCLRYFNACGADPAGEIGEWHTPETHLIPRALMAAAGQVSHLDVFGTDYDTPDGTCVRDYIHVCDLAEGHVRALDHLLEGGDSLSVNLGTGRGYSIREVLQAIAEVTGRAVPVRFGPRRPGDPATLVADASRAKRELGFVAKHSDMHTIVRTAWPFFDRHEAA